MNDLEQRLKQARQHAGFTQRKLSSLIGVSLRTMTNHEKDASKVTIQIAQKIAYECKVDEIWLLTGKGDMLGGKHDNITKVIIEHQDIVKQFKNPEKAKEMNEDLLKLEYVDENGFDEIHKIVKIKLEANEALKEENFDHSSKKTAKKDKNDLQDRKSS